MLILDGNRIHPERGIGKTLGFSVHGFKTRQALEKIGVKFTDDIKNKPDLVLHQCPAFSVTAVPGIPNVLYTAFESLDLPPNYKEPASKMDLIISVSEFTRTAFKRSFGDTIPLEKAHLGVDADIFKYARRHHVSGKPFIYLWVGAPDERKGWKIIQEVWRMFDSDPSVLLFIKTTGRNKRESFRNVIVDSRMYSEKEMFSLYAGAHCFVFPTYSEGFGLPLAEAMATGLPCIYTPWGGVTEFADRKVAAPVSHKLVDADYGVPTKCAIPAVYDVAKKMVTIKRDYSKYLSKGKKASQRIHSDFTWLKTAEKIKKILVEFLENRRKHGKLCAA